LQRGRKFTALTKLPLALSVPEVWSWIAFSELRPRPDTPFINEIIWAWQQTSIYQVLEALEARASAAPFCIWGPLSLDDKSWNGTTFKNVAWSPTGPKMLRSIVRHLSRRKGCIATFRDPPMSFAQS